MTFPNLKTLLGHSSKTQAFVGVDTEGVVVIVNEDGSTFAPGVGIVGRLVNALRDESGSEGEVRFLKGFTVAGDGAEGDFRWSDTPATDNGGTILNDGGYGSTSAGWRRIYSGPIQAEWFGVKGDCLEGSGDTSIGSAVVHVDTYIFTSSDLGKTFAIDAAGAAGKSLVGTIISVAGQDITLDVAATSTQSNKPCRWGTNDADNLRRWLKAQNDTLLAVLPYNAQESRLRGGKNYLVHRTGDRACIDLNSFQKLTSDYHAALVAASDDDIILNMACQYNEVRGIQFKFGKHAIQLFGRATTYGDAYLGHPINAQSMVRISGVLFYYQHGPSIWQDRSNVGANRVISGAIDLSDFEFYGNTVSMLASDGYTVRNGWVIVDTDRYPVLWDDGRPMGAFVVGDTIMVQNTSAAPLSSTAAAWFEGNGNITTRGFRAGGENGRPCFCLRTEGMTYAGQTIDGVVEDPTINTTLYTDADGWSSTSTRHFIEIEDVFPTAISIKRVQPFPTTASQRDHVPFGNPDCTIWVDSASITLDSIYAKSTTGLLVDIDVTVPFRFVYSNDRTTQNGQDIAHYLSTYQQRTNSPESPRAAYNYWWTSGPGNFGFDASWGAGSGVNNLTDTTIQIYGYTVRKFTSNTSGNTANASFYLDNAGPTKWGAAVPAGYYTLSVYVVADFSGYLGFVHDATHGGAQPRKFEVSPFPQRLSWSFWHNGSADKSLALVVSTIPGTLVTPGSIAIGLPMINAGREACAYTPPGLTIASAGDTGDSHDFGIASNAGRSLNGRLTATAAGAPAETDGTITLVMNGAYDLTAHFRGIDGSGNCFAGTRRAVFSRQSGTTTQLGTTETIGSDQSDAAAAGWLATLDNSGDDVRFRTASANLVVWEVTWELELRVV